MENKEMHELDMAQLEKINGGCISGVADDSELLHKLGLMDEDFNGFEVFFNWDSCTDKVTKAWEQIGITCKCHADYKNEYSYQGKSITWDEAKKIAIDKMIKGPQIKNPLTGQ